MSSENVERLQLAFESGSMFPATASMSPLRDGRALSLKIYRTWGEARAAAGMQG